MMDIEVPWHLIMYTGLINIPGGGGVVACVVGATDGVIGGVVCSDVRQQQI